MDLVDVCNMSFADLAICNHCLIDHVGVGVGVVMLLFVAMYFRHSEICCYTLINKIIRTIYFLVEELDLVIDYVEEANCFLEFWVFFFLAIVALEEILCGSSW